MILAPVVLAQALVITGATVYASPYEPVVKHAIVVITDSTIAAVGPDAAIPAKAKVLKCDGCAVMAGFWNTHVHFEQPMFDTTQPADTLAAHMEAMLTKYGFTTVIDLGSDPRNTTALRQRIARGEFAGPRILTAGSPVYPPNGIPFYLYPVLPAAAIAYMQANQTPATPAGARSVVDFDLGYGVDVIKLFTGAWVERNGTHVVQPMPDSVARAAVREAHAHHRLVFSHCSNLTGALVALNAGVDVMAHALDDTAGVDSTLFRRMVERHMSLIPTLSLFAGFPNTPAIVHEVTIFRSYGGQLLFGTDVGYTKAFDPTEEYVLLQQAGLDAQEVLRMLTTAPRSLLEGEREDERRAVVRVGSPADLTVLSRDPAVTDLRAFAHVRYTIRQGRVIYSGS
jgi:imidazolonepropionase-like amidohydrolase